VKAAEDAEEAAEKALEDAKSDGVITPEEKKAVEDANAAVEAAKDAAQKALDNLPDSTGKETLQNRLDNVNPVEVPLVTPTEEAASAIITPVTTGNDKGQVKIQLPQEAGVAEITYTDENGNPQTVTVTGVAQPNGNIRWTGHDSIRNGVVTLPADDVKDGSTVTVKTTPAAANKTPSTTTAQAPVDKAVDDLVKAVEDAQKAAQDKLDSLGDPKVVSPEAVAELEKLNKAVDDAKAAANEALSNVDDASPEKAGLKEKVDSANGVEVPAVNDANSNGIPDNVDDLVKAAKDADQAAKDALKEAQKDGVINPTEKTELDAAQKAASDAKKAADEAVKGLPDSIEGKDTLQGTVDALDGIQVPPVNDENSNGVPDSVDDLVNAAKVAAEAAKDALDKANSDNSITPEEKKAIENANAAVEAAKDAAQKAIDSLPDGQGKTAAQAELDKAKPVDVPDVTMTAKITSYDDDIGDITGNFLSGTQTDDANPTLKGTATKPNSTVYLFEKDAGGHYVKFAEVQADADGNWTYDVPQEKTLTIKKHSFYASTESTIPESTVESFDITVVRGSSHTFSDASMKKVSMNGTTISSLGPLGNSFDNLAAVSVNRSAYDVMTSNGQGGFGSKPLSINQPTYLQTGLGDFNGDGLNDVMVATHAISYKRNPAVAGVTTYTATLPNYSPTTANITLISGPDENASRVTINHNGLPATGIAGVGDVNGDGLSDVVVLGPTTSNVYFGKPFNEGGNPDQTGLEFNKAEADVTAKAPRAAALGDFNNDGYADVVTNKGIFFGSKEGLNNSNVLIFSNEVDSVNSAGDVNGDGYADAIVVSPEQDRAYILFGGNSTTPVSFGTDSITGGNGGIIIKGKEGTFTDKTAVSGIGDLDGDGLGDYVIANETGGSFVLFGAPGNTTTTVDLENIGVHGFVIPESATKGLAIAGFSDFNGDGLVDFALLHSPATASTNPRAGSSTGDVLLNPGQVTIFSGHRELNVQPTITVENGEAQGTEFSDFIGGTSGADKVYGNGGADVIYTGFGNDTIVLNQSNLDALARTNSYEQDGRFARVDGGQGVDTLSFASDVTTIDFSKITNAGIGYMATGVGMSRISNIEVLDLDKGESAKTLKIGVQDVLDLNHQLKTFGQAKHQVKVLGDAQDKVDLIGGNWEEAGTVTDSGVTYKAYNQTGATYGAQLLVEEAVTVQIA
ncbi:hypothetical protein BKK54_10850, partial [Rodentibacter genomosp. 1]